MAFGALAPFLSPPLVVDPSGTGTYLGAILNTQDNHPPIILFPMYIFPTTTGRTTVNTRISLYLEQKGIAGSPHEWQTNSIHKGIFLLKEKHLDAQIIGGGDINITHWDPQLPLVKIFTSLKLKNKAVSIPQYSHITTYTSGDTTTWLDQFLVTNKLDLISAHSGMPEDDSKYSYITISDHQPYYNEYKLHHVITSSHDPSLQSKLKKCGRTFDIKPESHMVEKFQKNLEDFTLTLPVPEDTIESHENLYNNIMKGILTAAKAAHPRYFQHKLWHGWNPESQLLHNLHRALKLARRFLPHQPTQAATLLTSFYHKHYNATNRDGEYTFRDIYDTLLLNSNNTAYLNLLNSTLTIENVDAMLKHISTLNHSSKRRQLRNKISTHCKQQEEAFDMGKIGRSIRSLLEKPGREQMIPPPDPRTNLPYTSQTTLHNDINTHFTTHFSNRSTWIQTTKLDEPETAHIRADILDGNWRKHESILLHSFPTELQPTACIFFDCMKRKASQEAQQELYTAYTNPVSLEEFARVLSSKKGGKSPGPSGVTINHLKLLPHDLKVILHNTLQYFFSKHHVPTQWQKRSMTLIAKQEEPTSFTHYRPIMLLEDTRKLWLTILKRRRDPIIHKYQLLNKSQYGGVNQAGTEDPILQITNCIEDSHERQTQLHILFLDQQRAFDSPRRLSGINLAWQRLGLHSMHADYITRLDDDNMIYARTPQYILNPSNTRHFNAAGGASQGDSDATNNFNVVYDISLDVHARISPEVDYYHFAAADGTLIPQLPTTFIDDWSSTHRTLTGAQHALNTHRVSGHIFNIFGNPKKHLHMALCWHNGTLVPLQPIDTLYAYNEHDIPMPIPQASPTELARFLGAQLQASNQPDSLTSLLKDKASNIARILSHKKSKPRIISRTIYSAVYPSLGYPLKFSNLSTTELTTIGTSLHKLIQQRHFLHDFPHAVIFAGHSAPYGLGQQHLSDYVNRSKYAIFTRLASSNNHSATVANALLARTMRYRGAWDDPSNTLTGCPFTNKRLDATPTWGHSLIHWLETIQVYPQLIYNTNQPTSVTRTPIAQQTYPHLQYTAEQILTALSVTDFLYVEELYQHGDQQAIDHEAHLKRILPFFPKIEDFIRHTYYHHLSLPITHGHILLRHNMFTSFPNDTMVTQFVHPVLKPDELAFEIRGWHVSPTSIHTTFEEWEDTVLEIYDDNEPDIFCFRHITSEQNTKTKYKYTHVKYPQLITIPPREHFTTPPTQPFNIPQELIMDLAKLQPSSIFTDGSFIPHSDPYTTISTAPNSISSSIVIPHAPGDWMTTPFSTINITAEAPFMCSYTTELIAAAFAAQLQFNTQPTLYTDCQSITKQLSIEQGEIKTFRRNDYSPYLNAVLSSNTRVEWIPAHSEVKKKHHTHTHLDIGNQIADSVAGHTILPRNLLPSKSYTYSLRDVIPQNQSSVRLTHNGTPIIALPHTIQKAVSLNKLNNYIIHRHDSYYHHLHTWDHMSWTPTTKALTLLLRGTNLSLPTQTFKRYAFKLLYDKFRNKAYQFKIRHPNPQPETVYPQCPLCNVQEDSTTHLFCKCTHPDIVHIRQRCIEQLRQALQEVEHLNPDLAISLLSGDDSRAWAGLFPPIPTSLHTSTNPSFLSESTIHKYATHMLPYTIPAAHQMWRVYTYTTHHSQPSHTRHHHTISSRGGINTLPGPTPPKSKTKKKIKISQAPKTKSITRTLDSWIKPSFEVLQVENPDVLDVHISYAPARTLNSNTLLEAEQELEQLVMDNTPHSRSYTHSSIQLELLSGMRSTPSQQQLHRLLRAGPINLHIHSIHYNSFLPIFNYHAMHVSNDLSMTPIHIFVRDQAFQNDVGDHG